MKLSPGIPPVYNDVRMRDINEPVLLPVVRRTELWCENNRFFMRTASISGQELHFTRFSVFQVSILMTVIDVGLLGSKNCSLKFVRKNMFPILTDFRWDFFRIHMSSVIFTITSRIPRTLKTWVSSPLYIDDLLVSQYAYFPICSWIIMILRTG